jgi:hypothetical protein
MKDIEAEIQKIKDMGHLPMSEIERHDVYAPMALPKIEEAAGGPLDPDDSNSPADPPPPNQDEDNAL